MTNSEIGFKDLLIEHFEHTRKTGWDKNEIVRQIKDLWISHLEKALKKGGKR